VVKLIGRSHGILGDPGSNSLYKNAG